MRFEVLPLLVEFEWTLRRRARRDRNAMKKTSQRSLLFRQNVNRTEADRRRVCPRHGGRGIKTQLRPRRRAMDRAAIGNRHIIWQLTPCGKVAGKRDAGV